MSFIAIDACQPLKTASQCARYEAVDTILDRCRGMTVRRRRSDALNPAAFSPAGDARNSTGMADIPSSDEAAFVVAYSRNVESGTWMR